MAERDCSVVLRHLRGDGPIEVLTRQRDFNLQVLPDPKDPSGQTGIPVPADTLVAFVATSYKEVSDGWWEFRSPIKTPSGAEAVKNIFAHGEDIMMVSVMSRLAGA